MEFSEGVSYDNSLKTFYLIAFGDNNSEVTLLSLSLLYG